MALLKKAATIAVLATAGVAGTAGIAAADDSGWPMPPQAGTGDNHQHQDGLIPIYALNNVDVSPNLGCVLNKTVPDLNVESLVGLVPIAVNLNHLLQHTQLNVLSNGNTTTDVTDDSCTSNQGSSQAGDNSHGSTGAGSSYSKHSTGTDAGSNNAENGKGAGGLLGGTGVLGTGL
ncbi:MAG TPA: hypothetical protein VGM10_09180 [Actinocrinis sp.]|jgi:hypothetical protein